MAAHATRAEKKVEKELDKAEKEHDKAAIKEAKGRLGSADRHEHKAQTHENKADTLSHKVQPGGGSYSGLNFPYSGAQVHPTYGYQRLPRDKKAERFEAKALEWEKRGNTTKAQKNRDKALRHRQRLQPGYVPVAHPQPFYVDKANRFDQRALRYQQMGLIPQAQRYHSRAARTRSKHGIAATGMTGQTFTSGFTSGMPLTTGVPLTTGMTSHTTSGQTIVGPIVPMGTAYQGLNFPYTGATQQSSYGYSKLSSAQKAQRFNTKAAEWERRGNVAKAQKNREKANHYRMIGQSGYAKPVRPQDYYTSRASSFDQKALLYQQYGQHDKALRSQQRAQRIRAKHNLAYSTAATGGSSYQFTPTYQGLAFPYTEASVHPTYGYQRLPHNKKAERFEAKAAEWERRGNVKKAQKNREKANRYRARTQPGYVAPPRTQTYYVDRANIFDQRSLQYQQWGLAPQATRYQQRAVRVRNKHNIPAPPPLYNRAAHHRAVPAPVAVAPY